ncbi:MAG: hypothetical protein NZ455_09475 [Bacteroidia bacterium]|nr:hypothetical protein [Bacteroidia bacterium]MDW8348437.1 hypothetical protein [Bacteroidia bacterium]
MDLKPIYIFLIVFGFFFQSCVHKSFLDVRERADFSQKRVALMQMPSDVEYTVNERTLQKYLGSKVPKEQYTTILSANYLTELSKQIQKQVKRQKKSTVEVTIFPPLDSTFIETNTKLKNIFSEKQPLQRLAKMNYDYLILVKTVKFNAKKSLIPVYGHKQDEGAFNERERVVIEGELQVYDVKNNTLIMLGLETGVSEVRILNKKGAISSALQDVTKRSSKAIVAGRNKTFKK